MRPPLSRVPIQLPAPRGSRAPVTGGRGGRRTRLRCWRSYCSAWILTDFWSSPSASRGPCRARARTAARYTMACNIQGGAGARAARLISSQGLLRADQVVHAFQDRALAPPAETCPIRRTDGRDVSTLYGREGRRGGWGAPQHAPHPWILRAAAGRRWLGSPERAASLFRECRSTLVLCWGETTHHVFPPVALICPNPTPEPYTQTLHPKPNPIHKPKPKPKPKPGRGWGPHGDSSQKSAIRRCSGFSSARRSRSPRCGGSTIATSVTVELLRPMGAARSEPFRPSISGRGACCRLSRAAPSGARGVTEHGLRARA